MAKKASFSLSPTKGVASLINRLLPQSIRGHGGISQIILSVPKRIRIIAATLIMIVLLTISSFFVFTTSWYLFVPIIIGVSFLTTYLAIFEGIRRVEWYTLFILPILFAVSLYLFYSLLPVRWLTRLPFLVLFGFGYYAMLLASNIFNVGVEKSIQLYRAAFSINYLAQTFVIFLVGMVMTSFRLNFLLNGLFTGVIALLLSYQLFWSVKLEDKYNMHTALLSLLVALIMSELAILLSFVPLRLNVVTLLITAIYYSTSGIIFNYLGDKLYKNVIREYAFVTIFILFIAILTLQW